MDGRLLFCIITLLLLGNGITTPLLFGNGVTTPLLFGNGVTTVWQWRYNGVGMVLEWPNLLTRFVIVLYLCCISLLYAMDHHDIPPDPDTVKCDICDGIYRRRGFANH